jgi:hypothetical protein
MAQLFAERGHHVLFLQKPRFLGRLVIGGEPPMESASAGEFVHHQLRLGRRATTLNAVYVRRQLVRLKQDWHPDAIVNFNYDYWFIRDVWPNESLLTVINDDFRGRARRWAAAEARAAQHETLRRSDAVFAVSTPLVRQCSESSSNVELFLPWARVPYTPPSEGVQRADLLYWGYINRRIDWTVVRRLADAGVTLHFVGPVEGRAAYAELKHERINVYGPSTLAGIRPIIDKCVAAILPYDLSRSTMEVTASNRTFDLLAMGLPLLNAAYPELLKSPQGVIVPCKTPEDYFSAWESARRMFHDLQRPLKEFLSAHTADSRYAQIKRALMI